MAADRRRSRQYQTLLLLREQESVSAAELADRFDVNVRTVYRDIEDLLQNQYPIQGTPGPDGGYRLRPDSAAAPPGVLDSEDAFVAHINQTPQPTAPTAPQAITARRADSGVGELAHALLEGKVHVDNTNLHAPEQQPELLAEVKRALKGSLALRITWPNPPADRPGQTEEVVVPLGLVWNTGRWHLVARDLEDQVFRARLSDLTQAEATGLTFTPPTDFNLEDWWTHQEQQSRQGDLQVVLTATPPAARDLAQLTQHLKPAVEELDNGQVRLEVLTNSWEWLLPHLIGHGSEVIAEEPGELRRELAQFHQSAADLYPTEDHEICPLRLDDQTSS